MVHDTNVVEDTLVRCRRCVTPTTYPGADLDDDGLCRYCADHEREYGDWEERKEQLSRRFERLLAWARKKKGTYNVLVPLSGGKDSTYVLYLATKVYRMKVLAFTFDNGFQTDVAKRNIDRAVRAAGVDHLHFRPDPAAMMTLYRHFLVKTGMFCPVCMRGIYASQFALARLFRIPLVLKGSSNRTEERCAPEIFQDGRISFFQNVLKQHPIPGVPACLWVDRNPREKLQRALYSLSGGRVLLAPVDVQVPDYHDWNYNEIYHTLNREFGWDKLPDRDDHVDCLVDPVVHYMRKKRIPDLTPNTLSYSAEIRAGQMDREEALSRVVEEMMDTALPPEADHIFERMEIDRKTLDRCLVDGLRHMEYQKESLPRRIYDTVRSWI